MGFFLCVLSTLALELFSLPLLQRCSPVRMCLKADAPSLRIQDDEHSSLEEEGGVKLFAGTFKQILWKRENARVNKLLLCSILVLACRGTRCKPVGQKCVLLESCCVRVSQLLLLLLHC